MTTRVMLAANKAIKPRVCFKRDVPGFMLSRLRCNDMQRYNIYHYEKRERQKASIAGLGLDVAFERYY